MVDISESERQGVVDVSETEQKDSDSQDETQFGVVWDKIVPDSEKETPISNVGHPWKWKDTTSPFHVFTPETEEQDSDAMKTRSPSVK